MAMSAEEQAEWESWVRANMATADVISYHSRLLGDSGWCFGCLEMENRRVKAPCPHRLTAERNLARAKVDKVAAHVSELRHG